MDNGNSWIYRRVISGFAWQGTSKLLVQATSWISTIVVARILDPADYGIMAVASVFLGLMAAIIDLGLAQALLQRITVTREEEDSVFWLSVFLGIALFLCLFFGAPTIAGFYAMPKLENVLRVCAFGLIISSVKAVPHAILMRRLDFRSRSLIEVGASLTSTVIVITLALYGYGVWSLAWGMLAQQAVLSVSYLPVLKRWPRVTLRFEPISEIVRSGMRLMGANLAYAVSSRADLFIIGKFLGDHFSGIYSLAFQLSAIPLDKIGTVFTHVAFPSLARVRSDDQQCRALFIELHRYLLFISYPVLIGIGVVARDLVPVLLGEKWSQAVPILQILCLVNAVRVSGMLISPALNSRGRERQSLNYSVMGVIVLPLSFLIGVQYGIEGVTAAWLVGYPLLYGMLLHYLRNELGVTLKELVTASRPTLIATAVMAGGVVMLQETVPLSLSHSGRLAAGIGIGALAYAAVFLIFYGEQVVRMRNALRILRGGSSA